MMVGDEIARCPHGPVPAAVWKTLANVSSMVSKGGCRSKTAREARADSLMALPPASLSPADIEWLRLHEAQRAERASAVRQRNSSHMVAGVAGFTAIVAGVIVAVVLAEDR